MNKLGKDKRDKMILVAIGTVALCAGLYMLVINSQRQTLRTVREQGQKSADQLARGQATLQTQAAVQAEYESATRALTTRQDAMAAPNDMYSWLIQTLNDFVNGTRTADGSATPKRYRVEIPQFGRELPTEVGVLPKFPYRAALFNIRGSAHYHDFGQFLADFENAFPYIRIQNIDLTPSTEASGESREKLGFKLELLTLVRPAN